MNNLKFTSNRNSQFFSLAVLLCSLAIVVTATQSTSPSVAGSMTFLAITTLVVALILRFRSSTLRLVFTLAFILRAAVAMAGLFLIELPDSTEDALRFQAVAFDLAESSWSELATNPITGAYFYSWINAIWAKATHASVASMVALNVFAGWLVVVTATVFALRTFGLRAAVRVGVALAVAPTLILYSAVTMREAFIVLLFIGSHAAFAHGLVKQSAPSIVIAWIFSFLTVLLHTAMLVPFALFSLICLFYFPRKNERSQRRHPWFKIAVIGTILALTSIGGSYILLTGAGLEKIATYSANSSDLFDALGNQQQYGARSRAAYLEGFTARTPLQAAAQLPLRVFYFLYSPFPWQIENVGDVIAATDGLVFAVLTILIARQVVRRRLSSLSTIMLVLATSALLVLAMTTSNYGTAVRHRAKLLPTLIIIGLGGASQPNSTRSHHYALSPSSQPRPRSRSFPDAP